MQESIVGAHPLDFASDEALLEFEQGFDLLAEMRSAGLLGSLEPELSEFGQDVVVGVLTGEIAVRMSRVMR